MAKNLIKNPSGEDNLNGWTTKGQWKVEGIPSKEIKLAGVQKCFAAVNPGTMSQEINLLDSFTADQLDSQPVVAVEDWYSGSGYSGSYYQIKVSLLGENNKEIAVFQPPNQPLDPDQSPWTQVFHTFSDYGSGLRHVRFEHGSTKHDGMRVTASSVKVYNRL